MLYLKGEEAEKFHTENTAIALGKFDGIHLGHQMIVNGLLKEKEQEKKALVFTFESAPNIILKDNLMQKNIYTREEKAKYFSELGVDILLEYPFTKEFAACEAKDFVLKFLVRKLGVRSVYVGTDCHFGKGRSGDINLLQVLGEEYQFKVHVITKKTLKNQIVSSTRIRDSLISDFDFANEMLGNPYFVFGPVIHGNHLGHTIGCPTINQEIAENKVIPSIGVYASRICIDGKYYRGISNLGKKPTVQKQNKIGLETYILDYQGDLYGKEIKTELLFYIRPERKFNNLDDLILQIKNDVSTMIHKIS